MLGIARASGANWAAVAGAVPLFLEGQRFKIPGYVDAAGPAPIGGRAVSVAARRFEGPGRRRRSTSFLATNQGTTVANSIWPDLALLAAQPEGPNLLNMLLPFLAIGAVFWFLLIRPQQREKKQRDAMLAAIKKNDRVITVGGIYGVVANVHREADEVTLKVDEAANFKLRVTVGSIARVLIDESSDDSSSK